MTGRGTVYAPPAVPVWHTLAVGDAASVLQVDLQTGLRAAEAARRAARYGPNEIPEQPRRRPWRMLLDPVA